MSGNECLVPCDIKCPQSRYGQPHAFAKGVPPVEKRNKAVNDPNVLIGSCIHLQFRAEGAEPHIGERDCVIVYE